MAQWKAIDWLASECCALKGAVEVLTDAEDNEVCDGDRARCTKHGCIGTVIEREGHMGIEWDDSQEKT